VWRSKDGDIVLDFNANGQLLGIDASEENIPLELLKEAEVIG